MSRTVLCYEPQARPNRVAISVEPGEAFSVYMMQDGLVEASQTLRNTVLRRSDQDPPAAAVLLFEAEVRPSRPNEAPRLRATKVGRIANIEVIRPEARSRMAAQSEFKSGSRIEAILPDMRTIQFSLEVQAEVATGGKAAAAGAGRTARSAAVQGVESALWIVPTAAAAFADPKARVIAYIGNIAKRAGINPSMFQPLLMVGLFTLGMGYLAFDQFQSAKDAELRAAEAAERALAAEAGRDAALIAEAACVSERKDLANALNDLEEKRKLLAEVAMAAPLARSISVELGGARMGTPEALEFDLTLSVSAQKVVVTEMAKLNAGDLVAERCTAMEAVLGQDLPDYMLLWHPDEDLLCPEEYLVVDGGVSRGGSWGISARAAREFGVPESAAKPGPDGVVADPRLNDRWSAYTLATGVRNIQEALLVADTGDRPPVAPGMAQLWTLALWDAYNRMPSPGDGVMDKTAGDCVADLLLERLAGSTPAAPGEPLLPDLAAVALGEPFKVTPTAGCPWTGDNIQKGAQSALRAAARQAVLAGAKESEGS